MNGGWKVSMNVWPHSTGDGQEKDRAKVTPLTRDFDIRATDFNDAVNQAKLLQRGVASAEWVWQAPITSLTFTGR